MKIIRLEAHNVKRLRAVDITPDLSNPLVQIAGRNAQGKTSTLDAMMYALAGGRTICEQPIRQGQTQADVTVTIGDEGGPQLIARRTWTAKGTELELLDAQGDPIKSPQAVLSHLVGTLTFDPLEFARMEGKKQLETLRKLVGLDFSELDQEHERLYHRRTELGRQVDTAKARLRGRRPAEGVPAKEVDVADLSSQLEAAVRCGSAVDSAKERARQGRVDQHREEANVSRIQAALRNLEDELDHARVKLLEQSRVANLLEQEAEALVRPDPAPIRAAIDAAQNTNLSVRANAELFRLEEEAQRLATQYGELTFRLAAIQAEKRAAVEAAKFPVEGLGLDDKVVLFQGLPLDQASRAETLRVSTGIGFALNPHLRVLYSRDASVLDEDSLRLLGALAAEKDGQLWLEVIHGGPGAIVIEDGLVTQVVGAGGPTAPAAG